MHRRQDPPPELTSLADLQGGVLTREQALTWLPARSVQRLVDNGAWRRLESGLFVAALGPLDFAGRAWSAVLAGGSGTVLVEHAAGYLQGICREEPPEIVAVVGRDCRRAAPPGVRFVRRAALPPARGLLSCTPPEETVLDLSAADDSNTVGWATSALRRRLTTVPRLRDALGRRKRLPTQVRRTLTAFLADGEGLESPLEHRYATAVERAHGLPRGARQFRRARQRHDVRYGLLLVELDGRMGHEDIDDVFRDMDRDNGAALDGLWTLRYGHTDCWQRACEVAAQVAGKLTQLGWQGQGHACRYCRNSGLWLA